MPTVSVKWQKQIIPAMEIGTSQPPFEFKSQLCALSGVPPERQKIMVQGGLLKVQLTGIYDVVAVLTHKGRSADYVFWVKQENAPFDAGKWIQYDDHNPIPRRVERILQSYLAAVKTLQEKSQVIGTWQKHLHG
ncbi:ubiquitin carboxyl-terminal hydrolase 6-like isoform X1 [Musa acuminata AAA Group]|uniref:ubiquitin carboxyl-terminal hydrolase 6-like isoform X1 n=1 Tax=Musa acuminata AAA Group TaxID=214697 RepID=UPI0031E1A487